MAVLDGAWWAAWWWPWAPAWALALVTVGVAAAVFLRARRRDRAPTGYRQYVVFSSQDKMRAIHAQHREPMETEVKKTVRWRRLARIGSRLPAALSAELEAATDQEVVETYLRKADAALVVRTVLEVLEKADDVVRVDLVDRQPVARPGRALERARDEASQPGRLSDLGGYVLLRGRFRREIDDSFTAELGDGTIVVRCSGPEPTPNRCQLLCLGQVGRWDPAGKQLSFSPLAILQT